MTDFQRYYATDLIADKNGACEVKQVRAVVATTGTVLVAPVAGKKLRILSVIASRTTAAESSVILTSSGGAAITPYLTCPAALGSAILPPDPLGWGDSATGEGISGTAGAVATDTQIRYIEVTP